MVKPLSRTDDADTTADASMGDPNGVKSKQLVLT